MTTSKPVRLARRTVVLSAFMVIRRYVLSQKVHHEWGIPAPAYTVARVELAKTMGSPKRVPGRGPPETGFAGLGPPRGESCSTWARFTQPRLADNGQARVSVGLLRSRRR